MDVDSALFMRCHTVAASACEAHACQGRLPKSQNPTSSLLFPALALSLHRVPLSLLSFRSALLSSRFLRRSPPPPFPSRSIRGRPIIYTTLARVALAQLVLGTPSSRGLGGCSSATPWLRHGSTIVQQGSSAQQPRPAGIGQQGTEPQWWGAAVHPVAQQGWAPTQPLAHQGQAALTAQGQG